MNWCQPSSYPLLTTPSLGHIILLSGVITGEVLIVTFSFYTVMPWISVEIQTEIWGVDGIKP